MNWDKTYNELKEVLGREPTIEEIQNEMLNKGFKGTN